MKKIYKLPLIMVFMLIFSINVYALEPMENFFVNDYVGVLSPEHVKEMTNDAAALAAQNGVQVVTVITENYEGSDPHSYAVDIYEDFGIGNEEDGNGVLLYVATEDKEVQIIVGDGMEYVLSDSKAGSIIDTYFIGPAGNGDFDNAVYDTYNALLSVGATATTTGQNYATSGTSASSMVMSAIMIFILIMIMVTVIFVLGNKKGKKTATPSYGQNITPDPYSQGNGYIQPNGYDTKNPPNPANQNLGQGSYNQGNTYGSQESNSQSDPYDAQGNYSSSNPYGEQGNYNQTNPYGNQSGYDPANPYGAPNENGQPGQYTPGKYGNTSNGTTQSNNNAAKIILLGGAARRVQYRNRPPFGGGAGGGAGRSFGGGRGGGGGFRGGGGHTGGGGAGRSF